ncbi:MAG: DUF4854 domain-containing protein [Clostridia bacterium]|nr:DUF4854 domain-containing protein [Clostridia bacterium]
MKKITSILAIVMACLICVLSLAGCGDRTLDGKYKTVEAYLADPTVKASIADSMDTGSDDLKVDVKGTENTLIYEYVFDEAYDEATIEIMKEGFESGVASLESTFVDVANSLVDVVAADDLGVVIRYIDANGTVIFEKTFKATK